MIRTVCSLILGMSVGFFISLVVWGLVGLVIQFYITVQSWN